MTRHVIPVPGDEKPTPEQVQAAIATVPEPLSRWLVYQIDGQWYVTVVTR